MIKTYHEALSVKEITNSMFEANNYDGTSEGKSAGGTKDDFGYDDDESKWAITAAGGIPPLV
jgi:hypothetical protein